MYDAFFQQLDSNSLILTGNKRLSRYLSKHYDQYQQSLMKAVWPSLSVIPLYNWLEDCWQQAQIKALTPSTTLLTEQQSQLLWENIIADTQGAELLNISNTALQALQAFRLLNEFQLDIDQAQLQQTAASRCLQIWIKAFKQQCEQQQLIDRSELINILLPLFERQELRAPNKIICLGFLELSPALQQLFSVLNAEVKTLHNTQAKQSYKANFNDNEKEIEQMCQWAKILCQQNPSMTIACIVPELNQHRLSIERAFKSQLDEKTYNLSSGNALKQEAVIDSALLALSLKTQRAAIQKISFFLRSPFFAGSETEFNQRAMLDFKLRDLDETQLKLTEIVYHARSCPTLKTHLAKFIEYTIPKQASCQQWAEKFSKLLLALGWPGERSLNSREYQAIQQWQQALTQLAQLDTVSNKITYWQALNYLTQICQNSLFQIQTPDAPIQILGLLEATALHFDAVWVMGLDDTHWPASAKANPFIPYQLQTQHHMPHCSAERELHFAKLMMQQLQQMAKTIIFSYPEHADDRELNASQLIKHLPDASINPTSTTTATAIELENLLDEQAPKISDKEKVRGGSWIFKQQAACPFRAFAEFRLKAESLSEPQAGLNGLERGAIAHRVLELFWQQTNSQKNLLALNDEQLKQKVLNCIDQALEETIGDKSLPFAFLKIERQRLLNLTQVCLDLEKQREPFVVIAEEKRQSAVIGGVPINMQIDRIDQLADGSYVIIDYKTGLSNLYSWFGERPDEPQLPLYATINERQLSGLLFSQIRADKIAFKGLTKHENQIPGAKTLAQLHYEEAQESWQEQLDDWHGTLNQLGKDFCDGKAEVDPKYGAQTCQFCDLQSLCRVLE